MLIVLCGLPGAGKTTLSNKMAELYNAQIYHYDNWRPDLKRQSRILARNKMYSDIRSDLLHGIDVIIDDLHLRGKDRLKLLSFVSDIPCDKILIVVDTPTDVCIFRNRHRKNRISDNFIYIAEKQFENPTLNEGWDSVIYYKGE